MARKGRGWSLDWNIDRLSDEEGRWGLIEDSKIGKITVMLETEDKGRITFLSCISFF